MRAKNAKLILAVLLALIGPLAWGQNTVTVKGTVVEAKSGLPVIGASVMVQGTVSGTVTGLDGDFSLSVPQGSTLVVSSIGFSDYTIEATKEMSGVRIRLEESAAARI